MARLASLALVCVLGCASAPAVDAGPDASSCAADDCPYSSYLCLGGVIVETPRNPLVGCVPPGWTCPSIDPIDAASVPCAARGCDPRHGPVSALYGDAAELCFPNDGGIDAN